MGMPFRAVKNRSSYTCLFRGRPGGTVKNGSSYKRPFIRMQVRTVKRRSSYKHPSNGKQVRLLKKKRPYIRPERSPRGLFSPTHAATGVGRPNRLNTRATRGAERALHEQAAPHSLMENSEGAAHPRNGSHTCSGISFANWSSSK